MSGDYASAAGGTRPGGVQAVPRCHRVASTAATCHAKVAAPADAAPQPNFYTNKHGRSFNDYIGCCYLNDFNAAAATMACPNPSEPWSSSCRQGRFAGPAWGHIFM